VLSIDLVATVERMRQELDEIEQGAVDIVIGTQLVAKGTISQAQSRWHRRRRSRAQQRRSARGRAHVPALHQVVGRAGREEGRGVGYLQTTSPSIR
jgi:primosomal protein N' (replication factor Y)